MESFLPFWGVIFGFGGHFEHFICFFLRQESYRMESRLASNSQSSDLTLPDAEIISMYHYD